MIYLSGRWHNDLGELPLGLVGYLRQPTGGAGPTSKAPKGTPWAADTGIYGSTPFDLGTYLIFLERLQSQQYCCLFATAPDVVADWEATLERSMPVVPTIRAMGYRAALVLQDGATPETVPWQEIDAVFTGGSTAWKLSENAYRLIAEAKRRGLWTHMGRVNSLRRLRAAATAGYDSADGTHMAFRPTKYAMEVISWCVRLEAEPSMRLDAALEAEV